MYDQSSPILESCKLNVLIIELLSMILTMHGIVSNYLMDVYLFHMY